MEKDPGSRIRERAHERTAPQQALGWLLKFMNARSDELPNLFSPNSDFPEFVYIGKRTVGKTWVPPPPPAELERFHKKFVQVVRNVIKGKGFGCMELPSCTAQWQLFHKSDGLEPRIVGSWKLDFLSRVTMLLALPKTNIKICPECARVFQPDHGLQQYCSHGCNERQRQHRLRTQRIEQIHNLQAKRRTPLTAAQTQKALGISLTQAAKFLKLANKEKADNATQTQRR